ncbi:hypothetical protein WICPIJ_007511 [Wickerhamomyces pijperi]|uniref:G-patch domain-containing protein n=1 Tax=Wickerhamomyces pijperi TaxID=599730 RepID=A0A9P8TK07_WICPI|nr:hypothetical protein WICPIJ_007511 [Wickerhamomyces pijperi]
MTGIKSDLRYLVIRILRSGRRLRITLNGKEPNKQMASLSVASSTPEASDHSEICLATTLVNIIIGQLMDRSIDTKYKDNQILSSFTIHNIHNIKPAAMPPKRPNLGFDSDSDSNETDQQPKILKPYKKPSKLPKLSFITKSIPSPVTEQVTISEDGDNEEEYLNMKFATDDADKSISTPEVTRTQESRTDKSRISLFGAVTDDSPLSGEPTGTASKSKGLSIMEKMGFKIGDTLGVDSKNEKALLVPINVTPLQKNSGIGNKSQTDTDESGLKIEENYINKGITKENEMEYRTRLNNDKKESKMLKTLHKMQKYCYDLTNDIEYPDGNPPDIRKINPLDMNILWRSYVIYIQSLLREREGISKGNEEDQNDEQDPNIQEGDDSDQEVDEELILFEDLDISERIERLHLHLRTTFDYCFYCGARYDNQQDLFENCPGVLEEDHE